MGWAHKGSGMLTRQLMAQPWVALMAKRAQIGRNPPGAVSLKRKLWSRGSMVSGSQGPVDASWKVCGSWGCGPGFPRSTGISYLEPLGKCKEQ